MAVFHCRIYSVFPPIPSEIYLGKCFNCKSGKGKNAIRLWFLNFSPFLIALYQRITFHLIPFSKSEKCLGQAYINKYSQLKVSKNQCLSQTTGI